MVIQVLIRMSTVVGIRVLGVNPYSAGIDVSRQNPTSKDDPRTVRVNIFLMAIDP